MPRTKKTNGFKAGDSVFYSWKGEALPAIVVKRIFDSKDEFMLNVFTPNGVMVVPRAKAGSEDGEFSLSGAQPVAVVEEVEAE